MKQKININIHLLILLAIVLQVLSVSAQYPAAAPGKNGIFVLFDRNLPVGFSYKLERKTADGKEDWTSVCTASFPVLSSSEIYNRLLSVNSKMPFYPVPDSSTIQKFINLVRGKKTTDSIYVYNAFPPYLEVLGTGYFDNLANPGISYEYRVSKIDKTRKVVQFSLVKAISFPGERKNFKATPVEVLPFGDKINIRFSVSGSSKPTGFRVYRQAYLQSPFREIHPSMAYLTSREGITMSLTDTLVVPRTIYNYVVVPYDVLGNDGLVSDTIQVNNVPKYGEVPSLKNLESISLDKELAIKLRWKVTEPENLRGISIYRSINFDDGYILYTRVNPADTIFIDRNVDPITNYYYYLVFNGAYGDSPESAKVIGMVKGLKEPVLPPQQVNIKSVIAGNSISWKAIGNDTKGYYVFRGEGYSNPSEQITDLIISDSLQVSYLDSASNLTPGQPYCYAVRSVNKSNLLSTFSETVIAEMIKPQLITPMNLEVRRFNGNALLIWEDMKAISSFITGYKVWRQEKGKEKIQLSENYHQSANRFIDTTLIRGVTYDYFIQAEGVVNSESRLSEPYEFTLLLIEPVPPAGLRATKTDQGIILNWDTPSFEGLSGFKIYREKLGEGKILITTVGADISNFADQVTGKGTYFYTITSTQKENRESAPSDEIGVSIE
jgi:hypothetical protein